MLCTIKARQTEYYFNFHIKDSINLFANTITFFNDPSYDYFFACKGNNFDENLNIIFVNHKDSLDLTESFLRLRYKYVYLVHKSNLTFIYKSHGLR